MSKEAVLDILNSLKMELKEKVNNGKKY